MMTLGYIVYALSNLVIAVMLGCMLQSAWENSSAWFRLVVALLAAAAVGAFFSSDRLGLQDLVDMVEVVKSVLLATVLVMMRARQIRAGRSKHSKQLERHEPTGTIPA